MKTALLLPPLLLILQSVYSGGWPVLKSYDQEHVYKIALPPGGIGTGTVSLGGRGNLQDWEIMNRPSKGYNPGSGRINSAFFTLFTETGGKKDLRLAEGPVPFYQYEGATGPTCLIISTTSGALPWVMKLHCLWLPIPDQDRQIPFLISLR